MKPPRKASIRDVALKANVSPATVSQILNQKLKASPETRQRVMDAVSALNYSPDPLYRDAVIQRSQGGKVLTKVIAYISQDSIHQKATTFDGFYSLILNGIQQGVTEGEYGLLMKPSTTNEHRIPDFIMEGKVDGVLVEGEFNQNWCQSLCNRIPVCYIYRPDSSLNANSVYPNFAKAAHDSMEYLVNLGHRNILTFSSPKSKHHQFLAKGVNQFFAEKGLPKCQYTVEEPVNITPETHEQVIREYAEHLLRMPERPTAIFTGDIYAITFLKIFRELSIRVPEDISLIGFDDTIAAQYSDPQLTSYRLPLHDIGRSAVEVLLQQIQDPFRPTRHLTLDGKLIERATVTHPCTVAPKTKRRK